MQFSSFTPAALAIPPTPTPGTFFLKKKKFGVAMLTLGLVAVGQVVNMTAVTSY